MALVAIPVWNGRVSPVLDCARRLFIVQINAGGVLRKKEVLLEESHPLAKVERLVSLQVDVLICGAISRSLACMFLNSGITVFAWISGPLEKVIQAFVAGRLLEPAYTMPGCSGQRMKACERRGQKSTKQNRFRKPLTQHKDDLLGS